jgi:alkaline phosphatase D
MNLFYFFRTIYALDLTFGSCAGMFGASNPEIWKSIQKIKPDAFIWLGDAIYADVMVLPLVFTVPSEEVWRRKYHQAKSAEGYKDLRNTTRILGIWDDHDYGNNDENRYFAYKKLSKQLFLDFLDEPKDSIRYQREGIYNSYDFYAGNLSIKVILLDDRTYKDPWNDEGDTLGEIQWNWLESELNLRSDLFIIMNGIQINVEDRLSITEKWHENSRKRLLKTLKPHPNTILVSGDVHYCEILEINCNEHSLYELTTSGLTHSVHTNYGIIADLFVALFYPYTYNLTPRVFSKNFGAINVDTNGNIVMKVMDSYGNDLLVHNTSLEQLKHKTGVNYNCQQSLLQRQIKHIASVNLVFFFPVLVWATLIVKFLRKYSFSY